MGSLANRQTEKGTRWSRRAAGCRNDEDGKNTLKYDHNPDRPADLRMQEGPGRIEPKIRHPNSPMEEAH
jgi:hypothetical protein